MEVGFKFQAWLDWSLLGILRSSEWHGWPVSISQKSCWRDCAVLRLCPLPVLAVLIKANPTSHPPSECITHSCISAYQDNGSYYFFVRNIGSRASHAKHSQWVPTIRMPPHPMLFEAYSVNVLNMQDAQRSTRPPCGRPAVLSNDKERRLAAAIDPPLPLSSTYDAQACRAGSIF